MSQLPLYRCHKLVRAAKIKALVVGGRLDLGEHGMIQVGPSWIREKHVEAGGYYVEYEDGYVSYSPAEAFEDGCTLVAS